MPVLEPYRPWPYQWREKGVAFSKWAPVMFKQVSYPYEYLGTTTLHNPPPTNSVNLDYVVTWAKTQGVANFYEMEPPPLDQKGFIRLFTILIFEDGLPHHYYYELEITQTFTTDYVSEPLRVPWIGVPPAFDAPQTRELVFELRNQLPPLDRRTLSMIPPRTCRQWPPL